MSVHPDVDAMSEAAAAAVARDAELAVRERGRFTIALAGGSTPRRLYELLAAQYGARLPWSDVHVFFGDERCVGPTDAASNFRMAREALLSRVPIPADQVHRIAGELPPDEAAQTYEALLRGVFAQGEPHAQAPSFTFDVALLGIGADGHTASLFPHSPALDEQQRWVVPARAPEYMPPPRQRITLTFPPLNGARRVYVLAAGAEKAHVVGDIMAGARTPRHPADSHARLPAACVRGEEATVWFLDRLAAGALATGAAGDAG